MVSALFSPDLSLAQVFFIVAAVAALVQVVVVVSHGNAMWLATAGALAVLFVALGLLVAF
jgi:hypothetical protein